MERYEIYKTEIGLCCNHTSATSTSMIANIQSIKDTLNKLLDTFYVVKFDGDNLILESDTTITVIENYQTTLEDPNLVDIKAKINNHIESNGYINKKVAEEVQKTPNYEKSKGTIKRYIAGFLVFASIVGIHSAFQLKRDSEQIRRNELTYQVQQVQVIDKKDLEDTVQEVINSSVIAVENIDEQQKQEICSELGNKLGLDASLLQAMFDKGGLPSSSWTNQEIKYFTLDESTGKYVENSIVISKENLGSKDTSILIRGAIIQNILLRRNNNLPIALQEYNIGTTNMDEIIAIYSKMSGQSIEDIIGNTNDLGWVDVVETEGLDNNYVPRVFKAIDAQTLTNIDIKTGTEYTVTNSYTETKQIN